MGESVLVVRREGFFDARWPHGLFAHGAASAELFRALEAAAFFVERDQAESNEAWKQLIPYCVVSHREEIFCTRRKSAGGEARLHGRLSIGLGGHVHPQDVAGNNSTITRGLERELREELVLGTALPGTLRPLGLVNDDTEAVGRVHVGLVFELEVASPELAAALQIREHAKLEGRFERLVELRRMWQDPRRFETWSRFLLEARLAGRVPIRRAKTPNEAESEPEEDERDHRPKDQEAGA